MNNENYKKIIFEKIILILPFVFYLIVATHKLANPSLWVDEGIEYSFSEESFKNLNYMVRYNSLQPPLYNWLLHLWLKISYDVFWIRFLSVLFGLAGAIGFYKSAKEVSGEKVALFSVIIYSCVFRLIYHFQEIAEYSLMLGAMCWAVYYFIKALKTTDTKNIIYFCIASIITFMSQYGATIVLISFALLLLIKTIIEREKRESFKLLISYFLSFIFIFLPVYFFYMRYQIQKDCYTPFLFNIHIEKNIIWDFIHNLILTVKYNLFPNLTYETREIYMNFNIPNMIINFLIVFFSIILFAAVLNIFKNNKNKVVIYLILSSIISWLLFYGVVKLGLYSYGAFGFRWGLFITPLWLLTLIVSISEFISNLKLSTNKWVRTAKFFVLTIVTSLTFLYCFIGVFAIYHHWEKENTKGIIQKWYQIKAYKNLTILSYGAGYGFIYYLETTPEYMKMAEHKNIMFMPWLQESDYKEYKNLFEESLKVDFETPLIYFCFAHTFDDVYTIIKVFSDKGYQPQQIYNSYDGYIYKLTLDKKVGD